MNVRRERHLFMKLLLCQTRQTTTVSKMFKMMRDEELTPIAREAYRLAKKIEREKKIKVGNEVINIDKVIVFKDTGVVSGFDVILDNKLDLYNYYIRDRSGRTYARIRMTKKGIVTAVGLEADGKNWVAIVYRDS